MRTTLALVVASVFLVSAPALVVADAIPSCPAGQHVVMNPVPPHAMHHGGGHCEPNPPPTKHGRRHPTTTQHPPPPPAPPSSSGSGGSRS